MFLPTEYAWLEPVLIAAVVVFVIALIGNILSFSNRFVNAIVTGLVYIAIFAGVIYASNIQAPASPVHFLPAEYAWLELVLIGGAVLFVIDLIANTLSFSNRFVSAIVTAIVFAIVFGALTYVAKQEGIEVPAVTTPAPAPAPAP
jgi:xanthine/uracil permease